MWLCHWLGAAISVDVQHSLDSNYKKQAEVDASTQQRAAAKGCRSAVKDLETAMEDG
jgi:hypothetical protein